VENDLVDVRFQERREDQHISDFDVLRHVLCVLFAGPHSADYALFITHRLGRKSRRSQVADSTARRVRNNELVELKIAEEMGAPDVYVDSEKDTCWYLWTGSIYCKVLRVENRTGLYVIALKTGPHAELGKHRHRGEVRAYTVGDGHWGYHE
jgi:hypothetical protein